MTRPVSLTATALLLAGLVHAAGCGDSKVRDETTEPFVLRSALLYGEGFELSWGEPPQGEVHGFALFRRGPEGITALACPASCGPDLKGSEYCVEVGRECKGGLAPDARSFVDDSVAQTSADDDPYFYELIVYGVDPEGGRFTLNRAIGGQRFRRPSLIVGNGSGYARTFTPLLRAITRGDGFEVVEVRTAPEGEDIEAAEFAQYAPDGVIVRLPVERGEQRFQVQLLSDRGMLSGIIHETVFVDLDIPQIRFVSPNDNEVFFASAASPVVVVVVEGAVSDASPIREATILRNGRRLGDSRLLLDPTGRFRRELPLGQGSHRIEVQAEDLAGNVSEVALIRVQVELDNIPPVVEAFHADAPDGELRPGDVVHFRLYAAEAGTATVRIGTVADGIALSDSGALGDPHAGDFVFERDWVVPDGIDVDAGLVTARFADSAGNQVEIDAPERLTIKPLSESLPTVITGVVELEVPEDGVFLAPGDMQVDEDGVLIIPAGVTVKFPADTRLVVEGGLIAEGSAQLPIIFTVDQVNPRRGAWRGIELRGSGEKLSVLRYVTIENAGGRPGRLDPLGPINTARGTALIVEAPALITESYIAESGGVGVSIDLPVETPDHAPFAFAQNRITSNSGDGLVLGHVPPGAIVGHNLVTRNSGSGLVLTYTAEESVLALPSFTFDANQTGALRCGGPDALLGRRRLPFTNFLGNGIYEVILTADRPSAEVGTGVLDLSPSWWDGDAAQFVEGQIIHNVPGTVGRAAFEPMSPVELPEQVRIVEPAMGQSVSSAAPVRFIAEAPTPSGMAFDARRVRWWSDQDGLLGEGWEAELMLSPGPHRITVQLDHNELPEPVFATLLVSASDVDASWARTHAPSTPEIGAHFMVDAGAGVVFALGSNDAGEAALRRFDGVTGGWSLPEAEGAPAQPLPWAVGAMDDVGDLWIAGGSTDAGALSALYRVTLPAAAGDTVRWEEVDGAVPGLLSDPVSLRHGGYAMVWDETTARLLLIGVRGEVWSQEGDLGWVQVTLESEGPPGRMLHGGAVADVARGRVVALFADLDRERVETWRLDGNSWTKLELEAQGPVYLHGAAIAHDSQQSLILMFGGRDQDGEVHGGLRVFDLAQDRWQATSPAGYEVDPRPRYGSAAVHISSEGHTLWGGGLVPGRERALRDLWSVRVAPAR